jgi:toxin ParE1/3/4
MAEYILSNEAKNDLIRIQQYRVEKFGEIKADNYFNTFFDYFDMTADRPFSYESVDPIKEGYRRCFCGADSIYFRINDNDNIVEIMAIIGQQDITGIII